MANKNIRRILAEQSRKAGLPAAAPTRDVTNAPFERDNISSVALDHHERPAQAAADYRAARRRELAKHGQLARIEDGG